MNKSKIKKAEAELKKIVSMKQDLQRYIDCSWKSTLLKSCELCELVWEKEIVRLKSISETKASNKIKKAANLQEKKFAGLTSTELEEIAFDIYTPDAMAQMALTELIKMA
jgi:hypothetical protein